GPSGVPFGRIMEGAREVLRERYASGPVVRAALDTVADRRRLALFSWITRLAGRLGLTRLAARLPGRLGWAASLAPLGEGAAFRGAERPDPEACVFAGCIMREAFGETERATVRLLERDGLRVTVPEEQACCGALHAHAAAAARRLPGRLPPGPRPARARAAAWPTARDRGRDARRDRGPGALLW